MLLLYVTQDHKTISVIFFLKLNNFFPLMYGLLGSDNIWPIYNFLNIWNLRAQKNLNIEKIAFKVVQMKVLAMHITNQK